MGEYNGKSILLVGYDQTLSSLSGYEIALQAYGFGTFRARTFAEAIQFILTMHISLVIFYAYNDTLSKPIDAYEGNLPLTIYWYMPHVDAVPTRSGVCCVDNHILPSEMVKTVKELLQM